MRTRVTLSCGLLLMGTACNPGSGFEQRARQDHPDQRENSLKGEFSIARSDIAPSDPLPLPTPEKTRRVQRRLLEERFKGSETPRSKEFDACLRSIIPSDSDWGALEARAFLGELHRRCLQTPLDEVQFKFGLEELSLALPTTIARAKGSGEPIQLRYKTGHFHPEDAHLQLRIVDAPLSHCRAAGFSARVSNSGAYVSCELRLE